MNRYLVIAFPDEKAAFEGSTALKDLHAQGDISLYATAVVTKDADGRLAVRDTDDQGPVGLALGSLVGGLVGLFGGPAGVAVGAAGGALVGSMTDLYDSGVGLDFLDEVSSKVGPGSVCVVAEVTEDWTTPVDTRMEALGGSVLRTARIDFEDMQLGRDIEAWNAELDALDAEIEQADQEARAKLKAKREAIQAKITSARERAESKIKSAKEETQAKFDALRKQATDAKDAAKAAIDKRIEAIKADRDARVAKLEQAKDLTGEALAP